MKGEKHNDICAEKLITWDRTWPGYHALTGDNENNERND
jgi:hypothetical protein